MVKKTLDGLLDCKEIQPINPKGNQFWIFIGRADAEAEAPILWSTDIKSWFPLVRIDWFYLLAIQGTLKSLLQHYNSKESIFLHLVQLSYPYMTTGKTIALTIWTFVF